MKNGIFLLLLLLMSCSTPQPDSDPDDDTPDDPVYVLMLDPGHAICVRPQE